MGNKQNRKNKRSLGTSSKVRSKGTGHTNPKYNLLIMAKIANFYEFPIENR